MVLAVTWVMTSQEYEAAVYFPSTHFSGFIVWNLACQCCIYTEPKELLLLMHMEYCVMLNLRRSLKTKRTIHLEYRTASKKKPRRNQAKEKKQRKPDRMANSFLSRSLSWYKAWVHISRNDAGKVAGSLQTILCLLNLDSSYSIDK